MPERGRIVCAPNAYKGSLPAIAAAAAMAAAVRQWGGEPREVPVADGGDGTLDVLVAQAGTADATEHLRVSGPLGEPVTARVGWLGPGRAVVEMADAAGLRLLPATRREPLRAGTEGVGELIRHALDRGAEEIMIGIGGSASTDGGSGILRSLGVRMSGAGGRPIAAGGGGLEALAEIDISGLDSRLRHCRLLVVTDVRNPLCGEEGAAAVYGPQKGATAAEVQHLDAALQHYAATAATVFSRCDQAAPGSGAAGGAAFGLTLLGAEIVDGARFVCDRVGIDSQLQGADLVITGEGRFDAQSLSGKAPGEVLRRAAAAGVRAAVIAGRVLTDDGRAWQMRELVSYAADPLTDAAAAITAATADLLTALSAET